jgi:hypothetical protein
LVVRLFGLATEKIRGQRREAMGMVDNINERRAARILEKLFGDRFNLFEQDGLWHAGRFLTHNKRPDGGDFQAPWHRPQEVFGVGRTLDEALKFTGALANRSYSIAGVRPGERALQGWRVQFDTKGRIHGYISPGGIFSRRFGGAGDWN